jgi:integrase
MTSVRQTRKSDKPAKPYADFPLFPHATGRWAKKIRGRLHYFGPWSDPDGALRRYLDQKDDLHAGRTPRTSGDGLTLRQLLNRFLTSKKRLLDSGDITALTWRDYYEACARVAKSIRVSRLVSNLAADDFEGLRADLSQTRGPTALANDITRIRSVFKYGYDSGLIDRPVRFGPAFKKPSRRVLRKVRHDNGPWMFEAAEVRRILDAADPQLRAMILLGANCGFGNTDCAMLTLRHIDLEAGWIDFPRPKNENPRRCPLWPETLAAIREVLESRPDSRKAEDAELVFLTVKGGRWAKVGDRPLSKRMRTLLQRLGIHRKGLGFYCLRRTFEAVAGETIDQPAVDRIMGHIPAADDMAARCRQRISDDRLRAVTEHVRGWLFRESR